MRAVDLLPALTAFTKRQLLMLALLLAACLWTPYQVRAQGVDVVTLAVNKGDAHLTLEYSLRAQLTRTVEEALQKGVPVYFNAQATLYRSRWYWRDERVSRVVRPWRVVYQPLTDSWRVGIGALNQNVASLQEAMAVITRTSGWQVADLGVLDPGSRYYIEFAFRLDTSQLPAPMLVGLTTQAEWQLGVERTLRIE